MPPAFRYSLSTIHCPAARHYHSALSIWLSVDPMADKYPGTSPYTYCANNPVRLVDPDGREIDEWDFNIVTGQLTRVGDRGGKTTDYYNFKDLYGNTVGHAELPGGLHPEYCWETTMDEFGFRSSFYFTGSCAGYGTPYIFYEQSFAQSPPPTPSLGAQIVAFANSVDRMVMGHYDNSGLEGHGDYWDRKFAEAVEPYATAAVSMMPGISQINDVMTINGEDMFGNSATTTDKVVAGVSLVTVGTAKIPIRAVQSISKWVGWGAKSYTIWNTYKNERKK